MSAIAHPGKRRGGRVYTRAFDYDEAQRRYDAGESVKHLASEYGVTPQAVYNVVTEAGRRAVQTATENAKRRYQGRGVCDRCGGPMNLASRLYSGSRLCSDCAHLELATTVRENELRCVTCREWKSDEDFPYNRDGRKLHRGRHSQCRACITKARQDYRERHKVPCIDCGVRVLPPNEKTKSGIDVPRCRSCARREVIRRTAQPSAEDGGQQSKGKVSSGS